MVLMKRINFEKSRRQRCFLKKMVLKIRKIDKKSLFLIKYRPQACNFTKQETQAQVFSSEFWKKFKNNFLIEQLWTTASGSLNYIYRMQHYYTPWKECNIGSKWLNMILQTRFQLSVKYEFWILMECWFLGNIFMVMISKFTANKRNKSSQCFVSSSGLI